MVTKPKNKHILPLVVFAAGLLTISMAANALSPAFGQQQTQQKQYVGKLSGKNEVPPVNTSATGTANITVSPDGKSLHYVLAVHNMTGVMGAHIHVGTATQDGPVLIGLFNPKMSGPPSGKVNGMLAQGTITSADIKGNTTKPVLPHAGMTAQSVPDLVTLFNSSSAYVNVHTQMHQNGEIRGQIGPMSHG